MDGLSVYSGPFGKEQAERLLWRAGFGPRQGDAEALSKLGLAAAVQSLTQPAAPEQLVGPAPVGSGGVPIDPVDVYGDDHLWWLDQMIRTTTPLIERMTLIWHSWFATSNQGVATKDARAFRRGWTTGATHSQTPGSRRRLSSTTGT